MPAKSGLGNDLSKEVVVAPVDDSGVAIGVERPDALGSAMGAITSTNF